MCISDRESPNVYSFYKAILHRATSKLQSYSRKYLYVENRSILALEAAIKRHVK